MDPVGTVRFAIMICIVSMLVVMAGMPQNPWLWSCLRDSETFTFILIVDLIALMAMFPNMFKQDEQELKRRPSRKTRTALWLLEKFWSLKGSKIRGLRRRSTSKSFVDEPFPELVKQFTSEFDSDASTSPGSSRMSSPMPSPAFGPAATLRFPSDLSAISESEFMDSK